MEATPPDFEVEDELPALQANPGILKNPDLIIWSDKENAQAYTPPARIVARFHSNRRRSSAASSRRNSLSSSHSHHSNPPYRNRNSCQSNHVAQHLRRASIIESRKARLADKAAHAEQVRLRAALAKATPRTSNSEEKALAAQQAREKYLAKVAAACAEEVNRAKRVAEEMKEKKAAEEKRYRSELAEKHAEADRRRSELMKTPRKTRTSVAIQTDVKKSVESTGNSISQEIATLRVQRAWRRVYYQRALKSFTKLGLSIDRIRSCTFAEASELLADEGVLSSTSKMMTILGMSNASTGDSSAVRTFLCAFMILGHPEDIFNQNGQQEQDLVDKAKDVLISFESILSYSINCPSNRPPATQLEMLSQAHASYITAFAAWKSRDASVLVETMVDQFVALDAIWQTVKDDTRGDVAADYRAGIRDNQIILLSKIKKLVGADKVNALINKAIHQSRRAKLRRRPIADVRPRPLMTAESPIKTPTSEPHAPEDTVPKISGQEVVAADQGSGSSKLSTVFSIIPSNRVMCHELLMDPGFRIEVSPQSDPRNALNREVCDSMRRGIDQGQGEIWTVAVAENIRAKLLALLMPGNSIHQNLLEVLDTEHVRNQYRQGLFSYERFFIFMANLLPQLCAPVRDSEVQALAEVLKTAGDGVDAMIEKLFGLLHMIDVISLDYTNYRFHLQVPTIEQEGSGYEQRLFGQALETKTISLQRTKIWWRNASVNVLTEARNGDLMGGANFAKIYARGLIDLAVSMTPLREAEIPETLQLDINRLSRIRADMLRFTTVGGIIVRAKNLLRRDVRSQWKPECRRILESVKDGYNNEDGELGAKVLAIIESGHGMPASSRSHLAGIITRFLAESNSNHLTDPVLKLLFQKLKAHIFNRLAATSSVDRVRVASTASEGLAAIGLSEFMGQIGAVTDELARVASVDQAAHGIWYRRIAEEVEAMG